MKRLIEYVPATGISTYHDYDPLTKVSQIIEEQDAQPILEWNKKVSREGGYKDGIKRSWMHLATIPNNVIHKMVLETGLNPYSKEGVQYLTKMVHERDWNKLKVADGRYIRAN